MLLVKLLVYLFADGSHVNTGEPFVEIEVMKMYMALKAEELGIVHFQLSEGAVIIPGDVIAHTELDFSDRVVKAEVFTGDIFKIGEELKSSEGQDLPHLIYKNSREQLEKVLDGYALSETEIDHAHETCTGASMNKLQPAGQPTGQQINQQINQ